MNIFEEYLKKINTLVDKNKEILKLDNLNNFRGIVVETPPEEFNFDLSCNASLVLAKINKINPKELANKMKDLILKNLSDFENIDIAGPGFLNLKLTNKSLISNINKILIPLKKPAEYDEICDLILYLSSEKSSYITGATIRIDGGITTSDHPNLVNKIIKLKKKI